MAGYTPVFFDKRSAGRKQLEAVTHAHMTTKLTDKSGRSPGTALDLIEYKRGANKPSRVFCYFRVFRVFLGFLSSSFQKSHTLQTSLREYECYGARTRSNNYH